MMSSRMRTPSMVVVLRPRQSTSFTRAAEMVHLVTGTSRQGRGPRRTARLDRTHRAGQRLDSGRREACGGLDRRLGCVRAATERLPEMPEFPDFIGAVQLARQQTRLVAAQ